MELFRTEQMAGKTIPITQKQVLAAWQKVKAAGGSGGVDGKELADVEANLQNELYKLWNRMASGSYFPQPVKAVSIPKGDGSQRWLGIPTVEDRVVQQVVRDVLEPELEKVFHKDSYGYRPHKSAHQAVDKCRLRCYKQAWVIDLDIKGFFDNLNHDLLLKALEKHTDQQWITMYVKRWLEAEVKQQDGTLVKKGQGTPQGGVISPLLANLFLHYAFDKWMSHHHPEIAFERYADDVIIHCKTHKQASYILSKVKERMEECKLEVHPGKTKIAYCKSSKRQDKYPDVCFDFLGFTFQPRGSRNKEGEIFLSFGPAISRKAKKRITSTFKKWKIHRASNVELRDIAQALESKLRGWINYFGKFRQSELHRVFKRLNDRLVKWLMNKYKRYRNRVNAARAKLKSLAREHRNLFAHWRCGYLPK